MLKNIVLRAFLSGVSVYLIVSLAGTWNVDFALVFNLFGAGIIYGLFTLKPLKNECLSSKSNKLVVIAWLLTSTLSFIGGVWSTVLSSPVDLFHTPDTQNFALGGFVGALILVLGYTFVTKIRQEKLSLSNQLLTLAAGAIVPAILVSVFGDNVLSRNLDALSLFILWPTIITAVLVKGTHANANT